MCTFQTIHLRNLPTPVISTHQICPLKLCIGSQGSNESQGSNVCSHVNLIEKERLLVIDNVIREKTPRVSELEEKIKAHAKVISKVADNIDDVLSEIEERELHKIDVSAKHYNENLKELMSIKAKHEVKMERNKLELLNLETERNLEEMVLESLAQEKQRLVEILV